jgi:hypothetical protein
MVTTHKPEVIKRRNKWTSVTISHELLRELRIAKAMRNEEINVMLVKAWAAFKKAEGSRLHQPIDPANAA